MKVLFIYTCMVVGGSTTSLLSILNNIDYSKYDVDLLLLNRRGDLQHLINDNVNVLNVNLEYSNYKRYLMPQALKSQVVGTIISKIRKNRLLKAQICSEYLAKAQDKLPWKYDVAISFLEFWPSAFLVNNVNASKKIAWIHIDPVEAGLIAKYSKKKLSKVDKVVLVSNSCKSSFNQMFPEFSEKSIVIENLLDRKIVERLSEEECDLSLNKNHINFVSVCRINLASKGLDRVIRAFVRMRDDGYRIDNIFDWYIIGDGPDYQILCDMIKQNNLHNVFLLGKKLNPYKYMKKMDYFLLPSRYEGKPMAVTEAQMLGVIPLVCNYSSAGEQINNLCDGIIAENNDTDIFSYIKAISENRISKDSLLNNLKLRDFVYTETIEAICDMFNS